MAAAEQHRPDASIHDEILKFCSEPTDKPADKAILGEQLYKISSKPEKRVAVAAAPTLRSEKLSRLQRTRGFEASAYIFLFGKAANKRGPFSWLLQLCTNAICQMSS